MKMLNAEIFRTQVDLKLRVTARMKEKIKSAVSTTLL